MLNGYDLSNIEDQWESPWDQGQLVLAASDPDGVLFISTQADWRLKSLQPLTDAQKKQLISSRRYPDKTISALPFVKPEPLLQTLHNKQLIKIAPQDKQAAFHLLHQQVDMPDTQWRLHLFSRMTYPANQTLLVFLLSLVVLTLLTLLAAFLRERIRNERRLTLARNQLEVRVEERTHELLGSNVQLKKEIQIRKQAQESLQETRDELVQTAKMALLGQMSASINHELNQPLTALSNYAENALKLLKKEQYDKVQSNLQLVVELSRHMAEIIARFKIFSSKRPGNISQLDLNNSITAAIKIIHPQIEKQQVKLRLPNINKKVLVKGDSVLLQQVLVNLLSNAVQSLENFETKQLETETDTTEPLVRPEIEIHLIETSNSWQLSVLDNGCGISQHDIEHIFEPFFTTKGSGEGLGLGLPISRQIMQRLGGNLFVESDIQQGACFTMELAKADNL
ncbi:sensor histidine kinase [Pelagibaculum spongiae]|uniref:C4-dicarboxylate transport sensor protein DctB n=1 Tax=Pelagibaculum spongiae TaxID=2080658 RepID=A0A2V1H429_9GAMM|nr:ATP-binding protein [Pelagibaculum spongiae]PVZ71978.1 hypothetical protein DC094_02850 [Pelagibaculum spongiae]